MEPLMKSSDEGAQHLYNHHAAELAWEEGEAEEAKKHIAVAMKNNPYGNAVTSVLDYIINDKGSSDQLRDLINSKISDETEKETALKLLDDPMYGGKLKSGPKDSDEKEGDTQEVKDQKKKVRDLQAEIKELKNTLETAKGAKDKKSAESAEILAKVIPNKEKSLEREKQKLEELTSTKESSVYEKNLSFQSYLKIKHQNGF
jgi:hypothetical protein